MSSFRDSDGAPLVSVVICTRNRAAFLQKALASVVQQDFPKADYEIIVVDNASTDQTVKIVAEFRDRARVQYLREEQIGLTVARNTGWRAASGRFVAYLDDDAVALPGWLNSIASGFQAGPPSIAVIGGRIDPIWEKPSPPWLADEVALTLTIVNWGPNDKFVDPDREWLAGANFAASKAVLTELGGFHPWLGRVGDNLLSGEEILLQRQVIRRGHLCLYRPTMAVEHWIPASRLQPQWFFRRYYWQGVSEAIMHLIERSPTSTERARLALISCRNISAPTDGARSLLSDDDPRQFSPRLRDEFTARCVSLSSVGYVAGLLGAAGH